MTLSRSFSNYEELVNGCPRKLWFRKIAKIPEPQNSYAAIGTWYHAVIAELFRDTGTSLEEILGAVKKGRGWNCAVPDSDLLMEARFIEPRLRAAGLMDALEETFIEAWGRDVNPAAKYVSRLDLVSATTPKFDVADKVIGSVREPCVVDWKVLHKGGESRQTAKSAQLALECIDAGVRNAMFVEIPRDPMLPLHLVLSKFTEAELRGWDEHFQLWFQTMEQKGEVEGNFGLCPASSGLCAEKYCAFWNQCPGGRVRDRTGAFD